MRRWQLPLALLTLLTPGIPGQGDPTPSEQVQKRLEVSLQLDEADAVLALLEMRSADEEIAEEDWRRLETSEGYLRLKKRSEAFGGGDVRQSLRTFVLSDEPLANLAALRTTVEAFRELDVTEAAARALSYLPAEAHISATVYPVIKGQTNSFVFDLGGDPAVFLYVDPTRSAAELQNIVAHELHHVGAATCSPPDDLAELSEEARLVWKWLSAFDEGLAMLAAAGGPEVHPHASSPADAWIVWERDVAKFNSDVGLLQEFFVAVLTGELDKETGRARLFQFINTQDVPQGAFYTVGWKMGALVERAFGRDRVVAAVRDPRVLLASYNQIAKRHASNRSGSLARWDDAFMWEIHAEEALEAKSGEGE